MFCGQGAWRYLRQQIRKVSSALFYVMNQILIGQLIEQELHRQERTTVWFARKLGCNRTNAYKIFKRTSIDTDLLMRISIILNHDFFALYTSQLSQTAEAAANSR